MSSPGDGYNVFPCHYWVVITLIQPVFHLKNLHWLLCALWIPNQNITCNQLSYRFENEKKNLHPQVSGSCHLTWSLHSNFELSAAGSFGVNFKICHFFHPQTLWLQTSPWCSAGIWITSWRWKREVWDIGEAQKFERNNSDPNTHPNYTHKTHTHLFVSEI